MNDGWLYAVAVATLRLRCCRDDLSQEINNPEAEWTDREKDAFLENAYDLDRALILLRRVKDRARMNRRS
jgi:hypothetical protein